VFIKQAYDKPVRDCKIPLRVAVPRESTANKAGCNRACLELVGILTANGHEYEPEVVNPSRGVACRETGAPAIHAFQRCAFAPWRLGVEFRRGRAGKKDLQI
jgi:hypothetical protein